MVTPDNYLSVLKYYNLDLTSTDDTIKINISNDSETDELVGTLSNNILTFIFTFFNFI